MIWGIIIMKVIFVKNNDYMYYDDFYINGYKFIPRRKNIDSLFIVNNDMVRCILNKKLNKNINRIKKTIKLIVDSDVAITSDCDMMESELVRIINVYKSKYINYFDEFEFFDFIKDIYVLNKVIELKKKLIKEVI